MLHSNYSATHALAGGILIGIATLIGSATTGVPPGISGVLSEILQRPKGQMAWRVIFLIGLIAGAMAAFTLVEAASIYRPSRSLWAMGFAGVLVGIGTRVSGGCTSGHGVCGIALGSKRGIVATVLFMASAIATVYMINHLLTGAGR